MKAVRYLAAVALVCVAAACVDRNPAAPVPQAPQASLLGSLLAPTGLLKCSDLPFASTTATIGPDGGVISAGPHSLYVPAGALSAPTTITMTVPTGLGTNVVEFQPEGLRFEKPAALTMSYANCNLLGLLVPKRIAYTSSSLDILYYLLSVDNLFTRKVTGQVNHFSGYAIAW